MKKLALALALWAVPSLGFADIETFTPELNLSKPGVGTLNWGPKINANSDKLDAGVAARCKLTGCTMTGQLTVSSSVVVSGRLSVATATASAFFGDGSGLTGIIEAGTFASSKTFTNATDGILVYSSVTASAFFGNGSGLTNLATSPPAGITGSRTLEDGANILSVDWNNRRLVNASNAEVLSWAGLGVTIGTLTVQGGVFGTTATFTNTVQASTFNAVGSAYMMNGVVVIDHNREFFASTMTATYLSVTTLTVTGTAPSSIVGDLAVGGTLSATAFVGDGSGLTGLPGGGSNFPSGVTTPSVTALVGSGNSLSLTANDRVADVGTGGSITLVAGGDDTNFYTDGGNISVSGAPNVFVGGGVSINGGGGNSNGGDVSITGGNGRINNSGSVIIAGGHGLLGNGIHGGDISLTGGEGTNGSGGVLTLTGGQGLSGPGGDISIGSGLGSTNGSIALLTAGAPRVKILPTGEFGIGTVSPTAKLDVYGDSKFGTSNQLSISANGELVGLSSITASAFFGDGSGLTGIVGVGETGTFASSKTFTNATDGILVYSSVTASAFFGNGSGLTNLATSPPAGITGSRTLEDGANILSVDWNNRTLQDASPTLSVDWNNRHLVTGLTYSLDWSNPNNLVTTASMTASGFFGESLSVLTPIGVASGGTGTSDRTLKDGASVLSVDWNNRALLAATGPTSSLNWGNPNNLVTTASMTASGFFGSSLELGTNILYYCSGSTGGTYDGNTARGNSNAGACAGGTWVAISVKVD